MKYITREHLPFPVVREGQLGVDNTNARIEELDKEFNVWVRERLTLCNADDVERIMLEFDNIRWDREQYKEKYWNLIDLTNQLYEQYKTDMAKEQEKIREAREARNTSEAYINVLIAEKAELQRQLDAVEINDLD